MAQPTVPPRPARSQAQASLQPQPMIPPRPLRKTDPSPDREAFARSPLNFPPNSNGLARPPSNPLVNELKRQPSIDLPREVGQEGAEYTSYDHLPSAAHGVSISTETKNVSADVPLQQPRASVPSSTAKERISTVTRTDSTQAAAAGIGKARPDDDVHKVPAEMGSPLGRSRTADEYHPRRPPSADSHQLRARASFNRSNPNVSGSPRPPSIHGDHHEGIPEIGRQIPLNPFAGDVQAPSPSTGQAQFSQGIGFFNDGSARAHHRKRSSRHEFGPPGSFGMHGHGMEPQDQFERDWVAKHPQEAAKEGYNTWTPKPAAALSSEQLNRIVTHSEDAGMGTNRSMIGTPSQELAFDATEKYMMKMNSPKPSPLPIKEGGKRGSSASRAAAESPLRKTSFPFNDPSAGSAVVDDDVIHVDDIYRDGADHSDDIRRNAKRPGVDDSHYSSDRPRTPILASDEVLKRPGSAHMHAAVVSEYRDDDYYDSDFHNSRRSSLHVPSRPSSRPNSVHSSHGPPAGIHPGHKDYHGGPLHRYISHEEQHHSGLGTPLEEIEEYEPLFPDDDDKAAAVKKAAKARPRLAEHHFPSQDIWEDTPSSLQYVAEVATPEPLDNLNEEDGAPSSNAPPSKVFEHPDTEEKRKTNNPSNMLDDNKTFVKPHFKPEVQRSLQEHHRPGTQRFPSHDIWEDTPSELQLSTTVSGPQEDEDDDQPEQRPTTNAIPGSQDDPTARSTTGSGANFRPSVPERPQRGSRLAQEVSPAEVPDLGVDKRQAPSIPDRPKPSIPARPARSQEGADSARSPQQVKAKPAVPARPAGSKIAALQAGFMNDLNNRLRQGPQGPSPKARDSEEEEASEKAPLQDARKGRAKGPPRRNKSAVHEPSPLSFSITTATLWQIDETDELNVTTETAAPTTEANVDKVLSANEASNTQEPALRSPPTNAANAEPDDDAKIALAAQPPAAVGAEGDLPEPAISEGTLSSQKAIQPEMAASLHGSQPEMKDEAAQTGEKELHVSSGEGHKENMTAYVGGNAPEEGDVVVTGAAEPGSS